MRAAINVLSDLRLLSADRDADYMFTVSPVVVPLIGVDELLRLEAAYQAGAQNAGAAAPDVDYDTVEQELTNEA